MNSNLKTDELAKIICKTINEKNPQSVKHLIDMLKEITDLDENELLASIIDLQDKKEINFKNKYSIPKNFRSYALSSEGIWYWVIFLIEVITAIMVFTISENLYPWIYFRNILGLIFVLFIPGFGFMKAFFPLNQKERKLLSDIEIIERITLSFVMSLILISIIGLLLYYSPLGLNLFAIFFSLFIFSLVVDTIAIIREYHLKKTEL